MFTLGSRQKLDLDFVMPPDYKELTEAAYKYLSAEFVLNVPTISSSVELLRLLETVAGLHPNPQALYHNVSQIASIFLTRDWRDWRKKGERKKKELAPKQEELAYLLKLTIGYEEAGKKLNVVERNVNGILREFLNGDDDNEEEEEDEEDVESGEKGRNIKSRNAEAPFLNRDTFPIYFKVLVLEMNLGVREACSILINPFFFGKQTKNAGNFRRSQHHSHGYQSAHSLHGRWWNFRPTRVGILHYGSYC